MGFKFFRKRQDDVFLVLDIGTEAVKALLVKKDNAQNLVLGASVQYFERFGVFDSRDFGEDIIKKAVLKGVEEIKKKSSVINLKHQSVVLGLAPNILKARVVSQFFEREKSKEKISDREQKHICHHILEMAKKKISQIFASKSGILPSEIEWINLKIFAIKIDGYSVSGLSGYSGRNLDFKILATFLPRYYSENIKSIFKALDFKISRMVHIAENLSALFINRDISGAFLDVGGDISQIFLVKNGELTEIFDFPGGGRAFSQELTERLGLSEDSARVFKEEYSDKLLNIESEKRIKDIFSQEKTNWHQALIPKILSLPIFLFGGGCLLPEISEVFGNNNGVKIIYPADILNIQNQTKKLNNPQYVPALLLIL